MDNVLGGSASIVKFLDEKTDAEERAVQSRACNALPLFVHLSPDRGHNGRSRATVATLHPPARCFTARLIRNTLLLFEFERKVLLVSLDIRQTWTILILRLSLSLSRLCERHRRSLRAVKAVLLRQMSVKL